MFKHLKKSLSVFICLCLVITATVTLAGASFSGDSSPFTEAVSTSGALGSSIIRIINIVDHFMTYSYGDLGGRSYQSVAVEQILTVLLADKFSSVDDVFANLEKQRENNAASEVEDYYALLFDIDVYKYEYTFADTGISKTIEVGVFNDKTDEELTGDEEYILYFHGGAFVDAPLPFHYWFCSRLAALSDATVIMPMQLMAPEYIYTESYELSIALYEDLIECIDPADLTLMGDSSGGNYVVSMGLQLRDKGIALPSNIVAFSPWLHMSSTDQELLFLAQSGIDPMIVYWAAIMKAATFVGIDVSSVTSEQEAADLVLQIPDDNVYLNPYNADFTGMPPITIFTGTHEVLVGDSRNFIAKMELAYGEDAVVRHMEGETWDGSDVMFHYYEYEGMNHTFPLFPIPESVQVIGQIADIIK